MQEKSKKLGFWTIDNCRLYPGNGGSKNSKIQKRIEGIRLAKMRKVLDCGEGFIEGLDNDIGELKKFEREGRGEKRWLKALKSVFMGGIFVSVGDFSPPRRFLRRYLYLLDIYERSVCTSATADFEITSQTFSFSNGVLVNPLLACRLFLAPVLPSPSQNNSQHDAESHATRIETPIIVF